DGGPPRGKRPAPGPTSQVQSCHDQIVRMLAHSVPLMHWPKGQLDRRSRSVVELCRSAVRFLRPGGCASGGAHMRRVRVLLADDHTIVVEGLQSLLKDHFDLVGTVGDGRQLVDAARKLRPDIIVTDLSMPGMSGLDALRQLKAERLDARVI